ECRPANSRIGATGLRDRHRNKGALQKPAGREPRSRRTFLPSPLPSSAPIPLRAATTMPAAPIPPRRPGVIALCHSRTRALGRVFPRRCAAAAPAEGRRKGPHPARWRARVRKPCQPGLGPQGQQTASRRPRRLWLVGHSVSDWIGKADRPKAAGTEAYLASPSSGLQKETLNLTPGAFAAVQPGGEKPP